MRNETAFPLVGESRLFVWVVKCDQCDGIRVTVLIFVFQVFQF